MNITPRTSEILGTLCGMALLVLLTAIAWIAYSKFTEDPLNHGSTTPTSEIAAPETRADEPTSVPDTAGLEAVSKAAEPETEPVNEITNCPTTPFTEHILLRDAMRRVQEGRARSVSYLEKMGEGEDPSFYISFTSAQTRYSVRYWLSSEFGERSSLNFWEHPEGTRDQEHVLWYSDHGVDGCVNFGAGHNQVTLALWSNEGVENHALWQERYNVAARAFISAAGVRGP